MTLCGICKDASAEKGGLCRGCRILQLVDSARKYNWTADMDAELTRIYRRAKRRPDLTAALKSFAERHRLPRYIVTNRAQRLSLHLYRSTKWTPEEIAYIEDNAGSKGVLKIARNLHRSPGSVRLKAYALRISLAPTDSYSQSELAAHFGNHKASVAAWIRHGWLRVGKDNRIAHEDVVRFAWSHMDEYSFRNVNEPWLKSLLRERHGNASRDYAA